MDSLKTKEKLQKFFDKDISSIYEKDNLFYVTLDDDDFIKQVYEINISTNKVSEIGLSATTLYKHYKFIWSRNSG